MAGYTTIREAEGPGRRSGPRVTVGLAVEADDAREVLPDAMPVADRPAVVTGVVLVGGPAPPPEAPLAREEVAARAYAIWERSGRPDGTSDRDWLQAEAELRAERDVVLTPPPRAERDVVLTPPPRAGGRGAAMIVRAGPDAGSARCDRPAGRAAAGVARATVRLSGNVRYVTRSEWLGAPAVDPDGRIERSVDLPEEVYREIERGIARGVIEGMVLLDGQRRVDWFLDR